MTQKEKTAAIRWIQSLGLRVHVGIREVTLWEKGDPDRTWAFWSLQSACDYLKRSGRKVAA